MIVGICRETCDGERRVALTPASLAPLIKAGLKIQVEAGAGDEAGFPDSEYQAKGATVVKDRAQLIQQADVLVQVRAYGANPERGGADLTHMKAGQVVIGHAEPLLAHEQTKAMAARGVALLAMELIPRTTRAQAMDALSSQANLAGYRAVLIGQDHLPKIFPMMMTAAGTLKPAKVFVIGAGVAGLQAIATAKRLGAAVSATDVRPATKEQVESLGGKFVMVPEAMAEGEGGYAKELTPEQQAKQKTLVANVVADSDVVITTALIPGRPAPKLITAEMVQRMAPRSVIVDMAAERGGNCELTEPGKIVVKHGVTIVGLLNIPSDVAHDSSTMYAGNVVKLIGHLIGKTQEIQWNLEDEITRGVLVTKDGQVVHERVKQAMKLS
ncbi:MAG: Re/Si-specific NAD(P)(+) transhydrogenase subunit alpha [Phycisphaerales bacterium]